MVCGANLVLSRSYVLCSVALRFRGVPGPVFHCQADVHGRTTAFRQKQQAECVNHTANNAAAPKAELSADDGNHVNMGGEITTAAHTGLAGTSVPLVQWPHSTPSLSMIKKGTSRHLAMASQQAKVEENHSHEEYEAFMDESGTSRTEDVKVDTRASVSCPFCGQWRFEQRLNSVFLSWCRESPHLHGRRRLQRWPDQTMKKFAVIVFFAYTG